MNQNQGLGQDWDKDWSKHQSDDWSQNQVWKEILQLDLAQEFWQEQSVELCYEEIGFV